MPDPSVNPVDMWRDVPPPGDDAWAPPGDDDAPAPARKRRKPRKASTAPSPFGVGSHEEIQRHVMARFADERGPIVYNEGALYTYRDGVWSLLDDDDVWRAVQRVDGTAVADGRLFRVSDGVCKSVVALARAAYARKGWFDGAPYGLAFADGFLAVADHGLELVEHDPEHRCRHRYPFGYADTLTAPCTRWHEVLDEWGLSEAQQAYLAEWTGTALLGLAAKAQQFLMLTGEGHNGKSVCVDVITGLFPAEWTAAVSLHDFVDKFRTAELVGKRLNAVTEIEGRDLLNTATIKAVVSGDPITAERKYRDPFKFRPRAGLLFSLNTLPHVADHALGFWRRVALIPFLIEIVLEDRVEGYASRLLDAERTGIVGWALRGAADRLARGGFVALETDVLDEWRRASDPVALWRDERTTADGWTAASPLYDDFAAWARRNGHTVMTSTKDR